MLLWISLATGLIVFVFRNSLRARLEAALPERKTRHRVVGTIIAAFLIVFAIRLMVRFWSG